MKYAIISDIHGNFPALSAVVEDACKNGVEYYIFVGDYYMDLPFPNEVIDFVKNTFKSYVVRGNEEDYLRNLVSQDQKSWTDGQFCALYWSYKTINENNHKYLEGLPGKLTVSDGKIKINITHSSSEFIGDIEMREFSSFVLAEKFNVKPFSRGELLEDISKCLKFDKIFNGILSNLDDGIYIFGHAHVQWHSVFGNKVFINPGSCGLALDCEFGAPYTILNIENDIFDIEERRVKYDIYSLIDSLRDSSLYSEAKIWSDIIIKELQTREEHIGFFLKFVDWYADSINDSQRPFSAETWKKAFELWCEKNCI